VTKLAMGLEEEWKEDVGVLCNVIICQLANEYT